VCDDIGSGYLDDEDIECDDDEACRDGECEEVVCNPGTSRCDGNDIHVCDPTGTLETLSQTCTTNQYCNPNGGTAVCSPRVCTPGTVSCSSNILTTCNAQGSGTTVTQNCAATAQACYANECRSIVCEGNRACIGGNVRSCTQSGTNSTLYDTCTANE
jgi:hypothetical protein